MKALTLLLCLLVFTNSLYTSSYWSKKGINVEDGIIDVSEIPSISIDTVCNNVDLRTGVLRYEGIVKSGYLRVGKGNSALGFIFYGKEGILNEN
jgi:hypothetical protein